MDIRQSELYAKYMQKIGWIVEEVDGVVIFIKRFPLIGSMIKIQRQGLTLSVKQIDTLVKKYRAWRISLESNTTAIPTKSEGRVEGSPATASDVRDSSIRPAGLTRNDIIGNGFTINNSPYLPTKTIRIDLMASEDFFFQRFTETKRRAVRKAIKNGVIVKETRDIEEFVKLKSKDFWPLGYFMAKDIKALWKSFRPNNAITLLAYSSNKVRSSRIRSNNMRPIAGILLLFYDNTAYYWMAASSEEGKKLFAPTLLVWEALKLAKKKGCKVFDFEGIYDERFHNATKKWQGFTKFKEGFGGREIIFPTPLVKNRFS